MGGNAAAANTPLFHTVSHTCLETQIQVSRYEKNIKQSTNIIGNFVKNWQ